MPHKELHSVVTSSQFSGNIHIPLIVQPSTAYCLYNGGETTVTVTVKSTVTPVPPNCSSGEMRFERDWFTEITLDTELGHNFILEVYRG